MNARHVLWKEHEGVVIRDHEILAAMRPREFGSLVIVDVLTVHGMRHWEFHGWFDAIVHYCLLELMQRYYATGEL